MSTLVDAGNGGEVDTVAEAGRLQALDAYAVCGTAPEQAFDDIASLAADLCGAPIALVSLVGREQVWFKARHGLEVASAGRESVLCPLALRGTDLVELPDLTLVEEYARSPLVVGEPHARFYAGAPLLTADGHVIGSLCVLDSVPRRLTDAQRRGLRTLASHVVVQLELRRRVCQEAVANDRLRRADQLKSDFLARITHEFRTPLTCITGYLELLVAGGLGPDEVAESLHVVQRNSARLTGLVDDVLAASQLGGAAPAPERTVEDLFDLAAEAVAKHAGTAARRGVALELAAPLGPSEPSMAYVRGDRVGLACALSRVVSNAVLYTPAGGSATVSVTVEADRCAVSVTDTGVGVPADEVAEVLKPFCRGRYADERQVPGAGLGLPLAAATVQAHDGKLTFDSVHGAGTTVTIALPRA
ncbi:GAF domain-containing sensor histidine kinase [Motilibacter aurantiacus]|uniref:GAF domain-containing sensor histidine kinase n=1 Tax=Motilibacter aurantiacus TaxID=2714955 RepID=UPI0014087E30|nr:GAF domain-containing sensor histidine kinase [Motilibacter aurantiacus]NHC46656.1 GAF domain-containing sensor histidine kinase [Motilibacter aurantiacus]